MNKGIVLTDKELKKLQKIELEILIEFDRICRKHNIKYTLSGGTLLGAIRHDGFIPWDDDIDINMTRKEYNKFIKCQKKDLNTDKFYLDCIETKDDCGMIYSKLKRKDSLYIETASNRDRSEQNIWIDIFPVDKIKSNKSRLSCIRVYCLKIILMYKYGYIKTHDNRIIFNIVRFLSIFFNKEKLKKKICKLLTKYNDIDTDYYVEYASTYLGKQIMRKRVYTDYTEHKFENKKFMITKHYDEYLKTLYDDYMKLPPEEDRINHHYVEKIKFPK